ncbi:Non-classical phosphatidylinositol transfer protein (PITP) [Tulasnella sp. 403]|nr:Non-classical phosphatidylinositol transfer protein (PITP) [Tulasnella sp. 403]
MSDVQVAEPTPGIETPQPEKFTAVTAEVAPTVMAEKTSPLVEQFTETEKSAVKELITALPLIFEEAFKDLKDDAHKHEPVDFWGVPIDPLKGDLEDPRVSVILIKFLRARDMKLEPAQEMLISTLKWRHTFKASETVDEQFPEDVFGKLCHVYGKDKGGRPITYNVYGGDNDLKAIFGDLDRFLRYVISQQIVYLDRHRSPYPAGE